MRRVRTFVCMLALLALGVVPIAQAAVTYPQSTGDGPCEFTGAATIDTGSLLITGAGTGPGLFDGGAVAVLNCTTLTVSSGATVAVTGPRALDIRVAGDASIDGSINAGANGQSGGPGSALVPGYDGQDGGGHAGARGLGLSGGSGGATGAGSGGGGGGGGAGYAGGGGGAGGGASQNGGLGGGPVHALGGSPPNGGGAAGIGGPAGATAGANASSTNGGGGGGGSYGNQGPFHPGSGGGGGGSNSTGSAVGGHAGGGGGAIRIVATGTITLGAAGRIAANGTGGFPGQSGGGSGGGGSGGGIQLIAPTVSTTAGGELSARGGIGGALAGTASGGNGSPGRIDITANSTPGLAAVPAAAVTTYSETLTVTKAGTGGGSVASAPAGIACGGDCGEAYDPGTVVELTATADSGSTFGGWTGACTNATGPCQVTLDQARSVTATFTLAATTGDGASDQPPTTTTTTTTTTTVETPATQPAVTVPPAPAIALTGPAKQAVGKRGKFVLSALGAPAGRLTLTPVLRIGKRQTKLPKLVRTLSGGAKTVISVRLSKKVLLQLRKALRARRSVVILTTATLVAPSGTATARRTVRVKG